MINELTYGVVLGMAIAAAIYCLKNIVDFVLLKIKINKLKKTTANLKKANEKEIIACRHEWESITLAMMKLIGKHTVCKKCGYVSGTNYQLNQYALAAMHEGIKKREVVKQEQKYLEQRLEDEILRHRTIWVDQNLQKFIDIADSGPVTNKYAAFKGMLEDYGVYLRKKHQESVEKVYTEELQRRK